MEWDIPQRWKAHGKCYFWCSGLAQPTWRPWEGLIEVVFVKYSLVSRVCFPSCVWSHQDRLLNDGELAVGLCLTGSFFFS